MSSRNRALNCMNTELHLVVVLVNLNLKALAGLQHGTDTSLWNIKLEMGISALLY